MHTIDFVVNNDWGVGFTAQLIITNTGTESLDWSRLSFDAPFTIENIWGGRIQSDDGDRYVIDSELWNDTIAPDSRISVGFSARKEKGTDPEVNNLRINGLGAADPMPTPPSASEPVSNPTNGDIADAGGEAMPPNDNGAAPSENAPVQPLAASGETIRIEAEDYTRFSDNSQGNSGGKYRDDAVDIQTTSDVGGGHNVGWIRQGEWLTYDVALPESGTYKLSARVASKHSGSFSMQASIGGEDTTFTFDGTGSWQNWKTVTSEELTLDGGNHQLRLDMLSDSFNVNYLELIPVDAGTTPPTLPTPEPTPTPVPTPPAPDPNPSTGQFNYAEALQKSFLFYEAQRSGPLPDDKRLEWRGDSAINDGADVGRDLSGGYYDAGDHVKFGFPMAASMTMLSWGVNEYEEAYSQIGQLDEALDAIKWGTDYMLKAHVTDGNGTKEFWGQVGDGHIDHSFWGAPEAMSMSRPSFKIDRQNPGTDLAAEAAAALASASIIFRSSDPTYADELLTNAEQLFEFADTHRGKYSDAIPNAGNFYNSWSGYNDELAWGAAWLYKATGEASYLQQAESIYQNRIGGLGSFAQNWDDKSYGVATLLAQETGKQEYKQDVEGWLDSWVNGTNGVQITDGGLRWVGKWGSGRLAASTAFVAGVYADTVGDPAGQYGALVETTIDYLLGDNPRNSSYVVGFGENSPLRPHHRGAGSTPNSSAPNEHILYGALVGGPDQPNDFAYEDDRSNYVTNEVALDYNAGFTGALAYMVDNFGGDPLSNEELNALPGIVVVE
ncbi:MAG: glycoside hydrolase family 9 protein [Cyanobacteria bacterium P01_C01_bin.70]